MRVILHDLSIEEKGAYLADQLRDTDKIIERKEKDPLPCMGCFGCWVKTPGTCVIKDGYENTGAYLGNAEEYIIISKCSYGEFSPFVKKVIDRGISYCHPYFVKRSGECHHKMRYSNSLKIKVIFYGDDLTNKEIKCMEARAKAMAVNLGTTNITTEYLKSFEGGIRLCK